MKESEVMTMIKNSGIVKNEYSVMTSVVLD